MATALDLSISTTLANMARASANDDHGAIKGQSFEREVFRALEGSSPWEHCVGPDHFDMALDLVGRTGTHYEFDGAFLTRGTLYVIEAKKVGVLTREHVGIFVHKLLDVLLASRDHFNAVAIKPIVISAGPRISPAALLHAISWGILLVSPQRPTPLEMLASLNNLPDSSAVAELRTDCEQLAQRLWRPIDCLVYPSKPGSRLYHIATDQILDRDTSQHLMEFWEQCVIRAPAAVSAIP